MSAMGRFRMLRPSGKFGSKAAISLARVRALASLSGNWPPQSFGAIAKTGEHEDLIDLVTLRARARASLSLNSVRLAPEQRNRCSDLSLRVSR